MYELQFIKIPKPFKKNINTKTRYDLGEANRRYIKTIKAHEVEGERLEIDLLDVSTNEAYQFDLYAELESDLLELIIKHLGESIGALDEKDAEKVEALKQKITDEFMVKEVEPIDEVVSYVEIDDADQEEMVPEQAASVEEPVVLVETFEEVTSDNVVEIPEETLEEIVRRQEALMPEVIATEMVPHQEVELPEETLEEIVRRQEALMPEKVVEETVPHQEPEVLIGTSEDRVAQPVVFNEPGVEESVDLSDYLDASDFAALVKLKKLQTKVDEKINWSPEELFGFFSFINSEEISPEKKNETLLTYDFSVDLKNLKTEIAALIDGLEQQARKELELRYQQSLEDTDALLHAAKTSREKILAEQLEIDEKRFKSEVERDLAMEVDQLKAQQEQEIQRLMAKHQNEAADLETRQAVVLQTTCQNFNEEKMVELEKALDNHLKTELVNIQASQNEELQNYKKRLNQEQLNASSGRIERLQVGERKIVETLFNVLKFNVLKQEDPSFQEDYNPYSEQELPNLRSQMGSGLDQRINEVPVHHQQPAFDQNASVEQERRLEELRLQNQLLESKLTTSDTAKTSGTGSLNSGQKKWWIGGGIVLLLGAGAATTLALAQDSTPGEPSTTGQQPTTTAQLSNEQSFRAHLASGEYADAMRNYREHAPELVDYLFEREDADSLREVLELQVVETLHGLLNLAILEGQYERVVYEFERMAIEDRRDLNPRQQEGVLHAYDVLGKEPADF